NFMGADWRVEVRPSIRLNGNVQAEDGGFRGIPFSYALGHFSYSNFWWRVPDLVATRADGRLDLAYQGNDATHDYYFRFHSTIDPRAFRSLLQVNQQRGFDLVAFTTPPAVDGEVWGRWHELESIAGRGRIVATNFTIRGESASDLRAAFEYTNRVLKVIEPRLHRGTQEVAAASMIADFAARKIYVTNGFSTADPSSVARAIGPKIAKHFEPYTFRRPPTAHVEGVIPM